MLMVQDACRLVEAQLSADVHDAGRLWAETQCPADAHDASRPWTG